MDINILQQICIKSYIKFCLCVIILCIDCFQSQLVFITFFLLFCKARNQKINHLFQKRPNIEKVLLKGLTRGDHECFKKLYEKYSNPLYRFSLNYLKSEEIAEDVVQEVFIKIWDRRKDINTEKSFQSYLFTIALNVIRKYFNKQAESNQYKHDILASFSGDVEKMDARDNYQEMLDTLERLISQMPSRRADIFRKKKLEGLSQKEIAEAFNITTKTVEYHITESMKFLKKEFDKLKIGGMIFFCLFLDEGQG